VEVVHTIAELQARADGERAAGRRLALVPTMGALHEGHLSLVREGRQRADRVWLTIFVNPTQFNDPKDLAVYPHSLDDDLAKCAAAGVDVVFAPSAQEMYPEGSQISEGSQTWVDVTQLGLPLCGGSRPGHFRGVTTVVAKLFLAAKPHVAIFGEKDYQQLAVVRGMVRDLNFDIEVVGGETVREPDGLALSSRNVNLHPEARRQAPVLVRALEAAERAVAAGERNREALLHLVRNEIGKAPLAVIDYAELRDPDTLEPTAAELSGPVLLAMAAYLHPPEAGQGAGVRLIDSRILRP
jgi:pantoate--beta-alanine ligase